MNDGTSQVNLKAALAALVCFAITMGVIGDYWSVQCGKHWFTYCFISFLPYAVPGMAVIYFVFVWILSQYDFGHVRYWLLAGALAVLFFIGCFVFAHLQPEMQLFNGIDCEPF
jgi:drug/metabolite transporter (DMT)-like permease